MSQQSEHQGATGRAGGKRIWLFALAALGALLLLYGNRIPALLAGQEDPEPQQTAVLQDELSQYNAALCGEMERLCRGVKGAGEVRIAVSFEGGFTYLYASDREQIQDASGREQLGEHYITVGSGAAESAVLLSRVPPKIRGIGVVCSGGESASVRAEIVSLLGAAYGVGSNRIYVSDGES